MKKSPKTLLTAAMFAAAVNASAYEDVVTTANAQGLIKSGNGSAYSMDRSEYNSSAADNDYVTTTTYNPASTTPTTVYGPPVTTSTTTVPEDDTTTTTTLPEEFDPEITTVPVPVYGPPSVSTTTVHEDENITTTTILSDDYDPVITTITTTVVPVYGPPAVTTTTTPYEPEEELPAPVYGPPIILGDANADGNINSLDAVAFRKALVNGFPETAYMFDAYDINENGFIDENDLNQLIRYIKGDIDDIQDYYDPEQDEPVGLYAPPEYFK